ncbi:hypothetical protein CCHR01_02648 [Colletotrichum chrysophilum]|uniref:Uncharacterized protein n=1 Tax=Colletotrichum chrysophilum TaxID=1836956 RepID=A0AAD9AWM5_9PEZI|nr:hypothetical protein CCHR01_02648 [Colletotrichum chrysophilum]
MSIYTPRSFENTNPMKVDVNTTRKYVQNLQFFSDS